MKNLLIILSTISIIPSTLPTIKIETKNSTTQTDAIDFIDSFKNVVKVINISMGNSSLLNIYESEKFLENLVPEYYYDTLDNSKNEGFEGSVVRWTSKSKGSKQIIKTYENTYTNNSNLQQVRKTQSRKEKIEEKHEISLWGEEKITNEIKNTVGGKLKLPLGQVSEEFEFKFSSEITNGGQWNESRTKSIEEEIPSQEIVQNPYTILHVKYTVSQSFWDYEGIARFKVKDLHQKNLHIPFLYYDEDGNFDTIFWRYYSAEEIIQTLKQMGYSSQILADQKNNYSVISTNNIENPSEVFINLPIKWSSPISGIDLEHYEEEIEHI